MSTSLHNERDATAAKTPSLEARAAALHRAGSEEMVIGERIVAPVALPPRLDAALAYIRAELAAGRQWPGMEALAAHLKIKQGSVRLVLEDLRKAEKIQVIAWAPFDGSGKRKPAQWGLVP